MLTFIRIHCMIRIRMHINAGASARVDASTNTSTNTNANINMCISTRIHIIINNRVHKIHAAYAVYRELHFDI